FDPAAFPGASDPRRIHLFTCGAPTDYNRCKSTVSVTHCPCDPAQGDGCLGGTLDPQAVTAGLCMSGDRVVVDALDHDARAGGVVLTVDACSRRVLRLYGADSTLRGLVVEGTQACNPGTQLDAVAITGSRARRNRIEQALVVGPTNGDALSVEDGAG